MKTAVIISAQSEWDGLTPLFPAAQLEHYPYGHCFETTLNHFPLKFFQAGWGKTASAGALQYVLDHYSPDLTVNLGTCGGLAGVVNQGDVILVEGTYIYDIFELMDSVDVTDYYASTLDLSWLARSLPYPVRRGLIASADSDLLPEKIRLLKAREVIAADWESASLAWVAKKNNARLLILRAVSDLVSEERGELYDQFQDYKARSAAIMKMLIEQLPGWLGAVSI